MYISIRRAKVTPGSVPEIVRRVKSEFVPIISSLPGFMAYHLLDAGDDTVATVSIFQDRAGAEESNRRSAEWVKQTLSGMLATPLEFTTGEVKVHTVAETEMAMR